MPRSILMLLLFLPPALHAQETAKRVVETLPGERIVISNRFMGGDRLPDGATSFQAEGDFRSAKADAFASALEEAGIGLRQYLRERKPSIDVAIPPEMLREMVTKHDYVFEEETKMWRAVVSLAMSPDHLRQLRRSDRIGDSLWGLSGILGMLIFAALFFRADEYSRGYLTTTITLAFVGFAGIAGFLWWAAW